MFHVEQNLSPPCQKGEGHEVAGGFILLFPEGLAFPEGKVAFSKKMTDEGFYKYNF